MAFTKDPQLDTTQVDEYTLTFVKELLKKADLAKEDGSVDEKYASSLAEELQKSIGLMVMDELSGEDLEAYTKMIYETKPAPEELSKFLLEHIPDFPSKRDKVMEDFAVRILERTQQLRQSL